MNSLEAALSGREEPREAIPVGEQPRYANISPIGVAADQAYSIDIEDPKITVESEFVFYHDPGKCVRIESTAVLNGHAVVVLACRKVNGRCKKCSSTVAISVTDGGDKVLITKRVKIDCR